MKIKLNHLNVLVDVNMISFNSLIILYIYFIMELLKTEYSENKDIGKLDKV